MARFLKTGIIAIEDCLIDTQQGYSELEENLVPLACSQFPVPVFPLAFCLPLLGGAGVGYASCLLPSCPLFFVLFRPTFAISL